MLQDAPAAPGLRARVPGKVHDAAHEGTGFVVTACANNGLDGWDRLLEPIGASQGWSPSGLVIWGFIPSPGSRAVAAGQHRSSGSSRQADRPSTVWVCFPRPGLLHFPAKKKRRKRCCGGGIMKETSQESRIIQGVYPGRPKLVFVSFLFS